MKRIAFVGGGNMAEALVKGLIATGHGRDAIAACDPDDARRELLVRAYGVQATGDPSLALSEAAVVVLAVKPHVLPAAIATVVDALPANALVISVAAGATIASLEDALPPQTHVVRAMPNTPAMVLTGATAIAAGTHADETDLETARALFGAVGRCVHVPETAMDAVTGLSGSGPAYVMLFLEALADGGVRMGLPRDVALELAAQTILGAARLQLETGLHPGALKDRVTSPGGTTIAGVSALEENGFRSAVIEAVSAATRRAAELGRRK